MNNVKKYYGSITKSEDMGDGTLEVSGFASTESKDSDGETILASAMKAAIPDYMKFGAVREMHKNDAAGTAISIEVQPDGRTFFVAHVVDPIAVKKVQTGVYKGFSIGGKVQSRDDLNKSIITGLRLTEVSLVDRPANDGAVFTMYKAEKLEDDDVNKSLYSVSRFADILDCAGCIVSDATWEAKYDGSDSPLPAAMLKWLKQGMQLLQDLTAEESSKLTAYITSLKADTAGDLTKGGSQVDTTQQIETLVKSVKDLSDKVDTIVSGGTPATTPAAETDVQKAMKVIAAADPELAKALQVVTAQSDALAKANTTLTEDLAKANTMVTELQTASEALLKRAAPAKVVLNPVAITKGEDATPLNDEVDKSAPAEGTEARALYDIKKALKTGKALM